MSAETVRVRLNLVSSADGMPAVARAAQTLARERANAKNPDPKSVTIEELDGILLGNDPHESRVHKRDR